MHLESAPLRVAKALSDTCGRLLNFDSLVERNTDGHGGSLGAVSARDTVGARASAHAPGAIIRVARVARPLRSTLGMEASLLVERNSVRSVRAAKDVAAATAVVTTSEEGKRLGAAWGCACASA